MNNPNPELFDRLPPHDAEAETGVVGSILIDPNRADDVGGLLSPSMFYNAALGTIYSHLVAMRDEGQAVDVMLLASRLKDAGDLDSVGGAAELARILNSVPVAAHAVYYAQRVADRAERRRLIGIGWDFLRDCYGEGSDNRQVVSSLDSQLRNQAKQGDEVTSINNAATDALVMLDKVRQRQDKLGFATGLEKFDITWGGLFPGELVVLAARPRIGKTALACQIAYHFAAHNRPVYFVSLEMRNTQLAIRMMCSLAGVSLQDVRSGQVSDEDLDRLGEAGQPLGNIPWYIHDRARLTVADMYREARRIARDGLSLVVVDYLQRVTPADRRLPRHEQVGEMTTALKTMAMELDVPVLCLCQLSRAAEGDGIPKLYHLKDSGKIEEDADVVAILHRKTAGYPSTSEPRTADLMVAKNRNGEEDTITLDWIPERTMFASPSQEWTG